MNACAYTVGFMCNGSDHSVTMYANQNAHAVSTAQAHFTSNRLIMPIPFHCWQGVGNGSCCIKSAKISGMLINYVPLILKQPIPEGLDQSNPIDLSIIFLSTAIASL